MTYGGAIISLALVGGVVVALRLGWAKYIQPLLRKELDVIVADLASVHNRLDQYAADMELKIADHLEEIALHNSHVSAKRADAERAKRIRDRLNELLA